MSVRIAGSAQRLLIVILLGAVVGCGGATRQKVLYVVGVGTPEVVAFAASSSGTLKSLRMNPVGAAPTAIAIDPAKRFAYVLDSALGSPQGAISQFTLNSTSGALTAQTESTGASTTTGTPVPPIPVGTAPVAMVIDGGGKFVFVANQGDNTISVFTIDRSTGALAAVQTPFSNAPAMGPSALVVNGNRLFVANLAGGISVFTFDGKTGVLTAVSGSPFAPSASFCSPVADSTGKFIPCSPDVDPTGQVLYVPDKAANAVAAFSIASSGALTPLPGSPFTTGTTPVAVRVQRSGKFVYVANWGTNDLSIFAVDGTGALSQILGSPFPAGTQPAAIVSDSSGKLLFVANAGSDNISAFTVNARNGSLVPVANSPFTVDAGSPVGLAIIN